MCRVQLLSDFIGTKSKLIYDYFPEYGKVKHLFEDIYYLFFDHNLVEMANMQPQETGLKPVIFVSSKGGAKHGPRITVSNITGRFHPTDHFTVTTDGRIVGKCKLHQKHLDDVLDWVKLNKDHLHNVWHNGDIMASKEVSDGFRKV